MSGACSICGELNPGDGCAHHGAGAAVPARWGFVGRARELGVLRGALDAACAGDGRVALIAGEPGIGKTRLVEELTAEAVRRGARVLSAGCHEDAGAPAHWPWVQVMRLYVREVPADSLAADLGAGAAEIAQLVAEVRERLPETPFPMRSDPSSDRFRLFEAVVSFLSAAGARRPLVVVLEDLHWADAPSLALLRHVGRLLAGARLLIIATHRDVDPEPGHALTDALIELRRQRGTERVDLRGLNETEVESLIAVLLGGARHNAAQVLAAAVHRETEGNPLYEQLLCRVAVLGRR